MVEDARRPSPLALNGAVSVLCLVWGSTWLVIREGLADLPPFTSAGARFSVAGAAMLLLAPRIRRRAGGGAPPAWLWLTAGTLNFSTTYAVVYWCEQTLPSGLVSLLWAVFPLLVAVSGHLFLAGERLRSWQWLGFVVGFGGVGLLFRTDLASLGPGSLTAGAVLMVSPIVSAAGSTLVKRYGEDVSSALLNRNGMLLAAGSLLALAAVTERGAAVAWTVTAVLCVAYLSIVGTVTTYGLYFWLLRHAPAHRLSLISYVNPAIAVALGWAFAGEPVTGSTLAGAALVLAGVVLVVRGRR